MSVWFTLTATLHVVFGAIWVGSTLLYDLVVLEGVKSVSRESRGEFMRVTGPRMTVFFVVVALITVLTGGLLLYEFSRFNPSVLFGTRWGLLITAGGITGLFVYALGMATGITFSKILRTMAPDSRDPDSRDPMGAGDQLRAEGRLRTVEKLGKVEVVLILVVVLLMVLAAFPP